MTREDIIRMAREAGWEKARPFDDCPACGVFDVEHFAALVAAAERERLKWDGLHSCHPECDRPACVHTRKAVEAEREACAKICDEKAEEWREMRGWLDDFSNEIAAAIRARGQG